MVSLRRRLAHVLVLMGIISVSLGLSMSSALAASGDVWVDNVGQPSGPGHENDPHLKCQDINVWGADMAESSDVLTVQSWPPSGNKAVVYGPAPWEYHSGKQPQVIHRIPVRQLIASAIASGAHAQANQGFHFKLNVFQGDEVKHKVFWVKCASAPGSIEIFKASTAATSTGLVGARFMATNQTTGAVVMLDYTNSAGFVTNFAPAGVFTLHETIAPVGFNSAADVTVFVAPGLITDLTILDAPCSAAQIAAGTCPGHLSSLTVFTASSSGLALSGATFVLLNPETGAVANGPVTTDASGHATFSGVVPGKFILRETIAPVGFAASVDLFVDVSASATEQFVVNSPA
jgi:uncharacterized surface anchored protein